CSLAICSWRLLSSISRNRRAFWSASTDCAAKVCSSSTVLVGNLPGCFRRITSAPTTRFVPTSGRKSHLLTQPHHALAARAASKIVNLHHGRTSVPSVGIAMMRYHDMKLVVLDEVAAVNEDEPTLRREPGYTTGADRRSRNNG